MAVDDMVERVARAIQEGIPLEPTWEDCLGLARDAIAAMREPTEAMILRGEEDQYRVEYIWRYMIDESLKETTE